jgi:hypothetical protein
MKKKYRLEGDIQGAAVHFVESALAYSEAQAKKLIKLRLEKRYPSLKIFLINLNITVKGA